MKHKAISWFRRDSWTILIVSIVTVLIWTWAAGETRESTTLSQTLHFYVPDDSQEWIVEPSEITMTATIEGSRQSLSRAKTIIRSIRIELPAQAGDLTVNAVDELNAHADIRRAGVSVLTIDPSAEINLTLDRVVTRQAGIRPVLPGVLTQGEVTVDPQIVELSVPERVAASLPEDLVVEAFVGPGELERKEPGVPLTVRGRVRLPAGIITGSNYVRFSPPMANVSLTIRSIERTITLENVRVQMGGPAEDHEEYVITIADPILNNVQITADNELIRQIEEGQAIVVALVHLSSREKEQRITEKQVGIFVAMVPGKPALHQVTARVNDSDTPPTVRVQITPRSAQSAADASPTTTSD